MERTFIINTSLVLTFILILSCSTFAQNQYNVKDYGAIGDGKADDTKAFQKSFNKASLVSNSTIIIPSGKYKISETVNLDFSGDKTFVIKGVSSNNKPEILIDKPIVIFKIEGDKDHPSGDISIENIVFTGKNPPYSASHPYFNTYTRGAAVYVFNMLSLRFVENEILNIYGDGILVKNMKYKECLLSDRTEVLIENNRILNVWGQKNINSEGSVYAHYGDGICLNNVVNSIIRNNIIYNDLSKTKQYGRAGIVAEYNCEGIKIINNIIGGYESGVHFESDFGGHNVEGNTFKASEMGVFAFVYPTDYNRDFPLVIKDNIFNNLDIPKYSNLSRIRGKGERGFISIITRGDLRKQTKIIGNSFEVSGKYQFESDAQLRIYSNDVALEHNVFLNSDHNLLDSKPVVLLNGRVQVIKNNTFNNVNIKGSHLRNSLVNNNILRDGAKLDRN